MNFYKRNGRLNSQVLAQLTPKSVALLYDQKDKSCSHLNPRQRFIAMYLITLGEALFAALSMTTCTVALAFVAHRLIKEIQGLETERSTLQGQLDTALDQLHNRGKKFFIIPKPHNVLRLETTIPHPTLQKGEVIARQLIQIIDKRKWGHLPPWINDALYQLLRHYYVIRYW